MEKPQYSDEVRQLAFEIWSLKAGESVRTTRQMLLSGTYGDAVDIPERTLYRWAADDAWKERASEQLKALAPSIREHIFGQMIFTAAEGIEKVRIGVQNGETIDKGLVSLVMGLLDRTGFSPVGKNDTSKVLDEVKTTVKHLPADLSKLSNEELMALEADYTAARQRRA